VRLRGLRRYAALDIRELGSAAEVPSSGYVPGRRFTVSPQLSHALLFLPSQPAAFPTQPAALPSQPASLPSQPASLPSQSAALPPQPAALPSHTVFEHFIRRPVLRPVQDFVLDNDL